MSFRRVVHTFRSWCPGVGSAARFTPDLKANQPLIFMIVVLLISGVFTIAGVASAAYRQTHEPTHIGNVKVVREEFITTFYDNFPWNRYPKARYTIEFDIYFLSETDHFQIKDQIEPNLTLLSVHEDFKPNVHITYDATDGSIIIDISDAHIRQGEAGYPPFSYDLGVGRYSLSLRFEVEPPNKFVASKEPAFSFSPDNISRGQKTDLEVFISPFEVYDVEALGQVLVSVVVGPEEFICVSTSAKAVKSPAYPDNFVWEYHQSNIRAHSATFLVTVEEDLNVIARSNIQLWYLKPIYAVGEPVFEGGIVEFAGGGSRIGYQYELYASDYIAQCLADYS